MCSVGECTSTARLWPGETSSKRTCTKKGQAGQGERASECASPTLICSTRPMPRKRTNYRRRARVDDGPARRGSDWLRHARRQTTGQSARAAETCFLVIYSSSTRLLYLPMFSTIPSQLNSPHFCVPSIFDALLFPLPFFIHSLL